MQSPVDGRDGRSRSRARDHRAISERSHIDENVANNGQPTDNTRAIVGEGNRTPSQVQMAARNGQSRPGKRPIVSPADKLAAINRVRNGETKASVGRNIGVPESTLRGWCKSEHKIRSQCNNVATEMIPRHSPINIGNDRSMSANGRQSVSSRHFSNSRQSPSTPPDEDAPVTKRIKIERTGRQNSPQNVMTVPSTSWAGSYMSHGINYALPLAIQSLQTDPTQRNMYDASMIRSMIPNLNDMIPRNNSVGLVENGLQYNRNSSFPTMVGNSTTINNPTVNIEIDSVRNTMGNIIDNAMGNALDLTIGNRNIAVAPTQATSSSYTPKLMEALRAAKMNPSNAEIEQAIQYGTWLQEWLNKCSIPLLTEKQVLEHKYIVDVLKLVKNSTC